MAKLEEFVQGGGAVIFSGALPQETQSREPIRSSCSGRKPYYRRTGSILPRTPVPASIQSGAVGRSLDRLAIRSLTITENGKEDIGSYYCLREDEDYYYLAVMNEDERCKGRIKLGCAGPT